MAELNRRHQEIWTDLAAGLRVNIVSALKTIQFHLHSANDMTQLRAVRTLFQMAKAIQRILNTGPTDPRATADTPTFTDAQRQSLLDQLIDEDTAAAAAADDDDAQALAAAEPAKPVNPRLATPIPQPRPHIARHLWRVFQIPKNPPTIHPPT